MTTTAMPRPTARPRNISLHRRDLAADVDRHAARAARRPPRWRRSIAAGDPAQVLALDVGRQAHHAAACCSGRTRRASCPRPTSATSRSSSWPVAGLLDRDHARPRSTESMRWRRDLDLHLVADAGLRVGASSSARRSGSTRWPRPATGPRPRPSRRSGRPARGRRRPRRSGSRAPGRTAGRAATGPSPARARTFSA